MCGVKEVNTMSILAKFSLADTDTNNNESKRENNNITGILKEPGSSRQPLWRKRLSVTFDKSTIRLDGEKQFPKRRSSADDAQAKLQKEKPFPRRRISSADDVNEKLSRSEIADCLLASIHKNDVVGVEKMLNSRNVDINLTNLCGETALFMAVCYGRLEIINVLLKRHVNPNIADDQGNTALHEAVQLADVDVVTTLLEKARGIDINAKNLKGESPLHIAAEYDYATIAKKLLDCGASPNVKNANGRTPLLSALDDGSAAVCNVILRKKTRVDVNIADNDGNTALYIIVQSPYMKDVNIVEQLMQLGYRLQKDASWLNTVRRPDKFSQAPSLWKQIVDYVYA